MGKLLLLFASAIVSLEAGSYAYLTLKHRRDTLDIDRFVKSDIVDRYIRFATSKPGSLVMTHEQLGWVRAPSRTGMLGKNLYVTDDDGGRQVPDATGPHLISTYGDSFTEGLEVDNGQTWPAQLSYALGVNVRNYAVSGYGTDQALLYLEENLKNGKRTPIIILAFIPENLNRLVSAFRPFYTYPEPDFVSFKPIFVEVQPGHFEMKNFAPREPTPVAVANAIREASAIDHWYAVDREPSERTGSRWPFTWTVAQSLRPAARTSSLKRLREPPPVARQVMKYVIRRFHEASLKYQFTPVVVALPGTPHDFGAGISDLDEIFADRLPGLTYLDVSRNMSLPANTDYRDMFGITHYTAKANEEVARVVASQIRVFVDTIRPGYSAPAARPSLTIFDNAGESGLFGPGWYPAEIKGAVRWRWAGGERSTVEVQSAYAGPMTMTMRCNAIEWPDKPDQQVEVIINAQSVGTLTVSPELRDYTLDVPAGALKIGTNVIDLRYRWSVNPNATKGTGYYRTLAVAWHELKLIPR